MAASTSLTADAPTRQHPECSCPPGDRRLRGVGYLRGAPPVGLACLSPVLLVCDSCSGGAVLPCRSSRASRCVPCSESYRRRLTRVAAHRDASGSLPRGYFLTLTAPSFTEHGRFVPGRRGDHGRCPSGCGSAPGDLASWNATAAAAWNRLRLSLSRLSPGLEFFRVVEVQKRGALHLHVIVWADAPLLVGQVHAAALAAGFGCVLDLRPIRSGRDARHAAYVAKYATKASDQRGDVPWARPVAVVDAETGEVTQHVNPDPTYRTWSASRSWGLTMRDIREALRAHVARAADAASTDPHQPATEPPPADGPEPAT